MSNAEVMPEAIRASSSDSWVRWTCESIRPGRRVRFWPEIVGRLVGGLWV